jgi:phasin family protein
MASVMPLADVAPGKPAKPADVAQPVRSPAASPATGIQAIANAYRDYTKQSLEDAQTFAEKLSAARSLDKAVEAQTEFARQACETFADNSRKIRELHRELFWQTFRLPNWPLGRSQRQT